jgi:hypothetical protein
MRPYKPTQGTNSKAKAQKYLDFHTDDYNYSGLYCPCIGEGCREEYCASWVKAKVVLSNPGRLLEDQSIYDIIPGYCRNPMITGKIKTIT